MDIHAAEYFFIKTPFKKYLPFTLMHFFNFPSLRSASYQMRATQSIIYEYIGLRGWVSI
jgi:hypothetical protein